MTDPAAQPPPQSPPVPPPPPAAVPATRRRRIGPLLPISIAVVATLGGLALLLDRPTLIFTNRLVGPVQLVAGDATRTVARGESVQLRLSRGLGILQWQLTRPLSATGAPMGEDLRGSWVLRAPRGKLRYAATARGDTGDYFAPLITNETDRLLRITVNAGLEGAVDCRCAVRSGAHRVFMGYYRLYRNSTVRATDPAGRTATFRDLGPEAEARDWVVGLRFANQDLVSVPVPVPAP